LLTTELAATVRIFTQCRPGSPENANFQQEAQGLPTNNKKAASLRKESGPLLERESRRFPTLALPRSGAKGIGKESDSQP